MLPNRLIPLAGIALLLGLASTIGADARPDADRALPRTPFLMDLHLHSSFSEGTGTMSHHVAEAERAGYDGLWWTEHMGRNFLEYHLAHRVRFEGTRFSTPHPWAGRPLGKLEHTETRLGAAHLDYESFAAPQGQQYLRHELRSFAWETWIQSELSYRTASNIHRVSLFAEPHLRVHLRSSWLFGFANLIVRATLSSDPDGFTAEGTPRVLEWTIGGRPAPPAAANVRRSTIPGWVGWQEFDWNIVEEAAAHWANPRDMSLREVSILLVAGWGGMAVLDLDDFRIEVEAPMALEMFRSQERHLARHHSVDLFHHVGIELGDSMEEQLNPSAPRDHLIALFPDLIPELLYLAPGDPFAAQHPRGTVQWLHDRQAAVILAHPFGTATPPHVITNADAARRRAEILAHRAYEADAIEIGYFHRGRPLDDFLELWDALSADGVIVTGVGVSDNHDVEPWPARVNRMGTWIRSATPLAADLAASVKSGEVFFGDPHAFDVSGDFLIEAADGSFHMGDVVTTSGGVESFVVRVRGARPGDVIHVLQDARLVSVATPPAGANTSHSFTLAVQPGSWVRAELRGAGGEPILFSNPIYFQALGQPVAAERRP